MSEQLYEVTPKLARYMCDECKDGEMIHTGKMNLIDPPTFEHKCNHCETVKNFYEKYPTIRWFEEKVNGGNKDEVE